MQLIMVVIAQNDQALYNMKSLILTVTFIES